MSDCRRDSWTCASAIFACSDWILSARAGLPVVEASTAIRQAREKRRRRRGIVGVLATGGNVPARMQKSLDFSGFLGRRLLAALLGLGLRDLRRLRAVAPVRRQSGLRDV